MRAPVLLFGITLVAATAANAAADPAQARVDAYHQAVIAIARGGGTLAARTGRFEPVMRTYYDMPTIAALVVGARWTSASATDKAAAIAALTKHSAMQLASNFRSYGGERYVTDPHVAVRGADRLVRATLGSDALVYRLRQAGDGWKIVDVLSGGISQLAVQRSDFASTVASGGAAGLARQLATVDAKALDRH